MTLSDLLTRYHLTQTAFSRRFGIPLRTVQDWSADRRTPPQYVLTMADEILKKEQP